MTKLIGTPFCTSIRTMRRHERDNQNRPKLRCLLPRWRPGIKHETPLTAQEITMNERTPELRLARILRGRREAEGGYSALAKRINEEAHDEQRIDRRKLKKLIEGPEAKDTVRLGELQLIDRYLSRFGESLSHHPLLESKSLLDSLTESQHVRFLVGSKPRQSARPSFDVLDLAHRDVEAVASLQRDLGHRSAGRNQFDITPVAHPTPTDSHDWSTAREEASRELQSNRCTISVGSSIACLTSELMLAELLGVTPFKNATHRGSPIPAHLVWHRHEHRPESESCVSIPIGAVSALNESIASDVQAGKGDAVQLGEKLYFAAKRDGHDSRTYGIVVSSRRKNGSIWVVLAGLTGLGTQASAAALSQLSAPEPPTTPKQRVDWAVIEATVTIDMNRPVGSRRRLVDESIHVLQSGDSQQS